MSANPADDVDEGTEMGDELNDLIKELIKEFQIYKKELREGTKTQKQDADWRKRAHAYKMTEQQQHDDNVASHIKLRAQLSNATTGLQMFNSKLATGFTVGTVMTDLVNKIKDSAAAYDHNKDTIMALETQMANLSERMEEIGDPSNEEYKKFEGQYKDAEEKLKTEETKTEDNSWQKKLATFADKHKTGIFLGAAAVGTLLKVLKMALDASPMFQQMLKLLNFGIMMVLRPIGDFFGFLMRPIMVMLLRKFIIPWYTKMYPVMMKLGDVIGEKLSGAFEALADGDVAKAFAILFKDVDLAAILQNGLDGLSTWIAETDWEEVKKSIAKQLLALGTGIWEYILVPIGSFIYDNVSAWWEKSIADISDNWSALWLGVYSWFATGIANINDEFNKIWTHTYEWFAKGLDDTVTTFGDIWTKITDWFGKGIDEAATSFGDLWTAIWDWLTGKLRDIPVIGNLLSGDDANKPNSGDNVMDIINNGWTDFTSGVHDMFNQGTTNNNRNDQYTVNFYGGGNSQYESSVRSTMQEAAFRGRKH